MKRRPRNKADRARLLPLSECFVIDCSSIGGGFFVAQRSGEIAGLPALVDTHHFNTLGGVAKHVEERRQQEQQETLR